MKKIITISMSLTTLLFITAAFSQPVKVKYNTELPDCGIQKAIDSLHGKGGKVIIPIGNYKIKQSIRLPSNVTLAGEDNNLTVITKQPEMVTTLAKSGKTNSKIIYVKNAAKFKPGMQIAIASFDRNDRAPNGEYKIAWFTTQAIILKKQGNKLELDHGLKISYGKKVVVVNDFPAVWAQDGSNITIKNLKITSTNKPRFVNFVNDAVHIVRSKNVRISDLNVAGWPADCIGVQGGKNVYVTNNQVSSCYGHGLHPGTGLQFAIFSHNISHDNLGDGLFFCLDVHHIIVSNNIFYNNGIYGIGGLAQGTSNTANAIINNIFYANRRGSIDAAMIAPDLIRNNVYTGADKLKMNMFAKLFSGNF
jgi:hypothetical protein